MPNSQEGTQDYREKKNVAKIGIIEEQKMVLDHNAISLDMLRARQREYEVLCLDIEVVTERLKALKELINTIDFNDIFHSKHLEEVKAGEKDVVVGNNKNIDISIS